VIGLPNIFCSLSCRGNDYRRGQRYRAMAKESTLAKLSLDLEIESQSSASSSKTVEGCCATSITSYLSSWCEANLLKKLKKGCTVEFLGQILMVSMTLLLIRLICESLGYDSDDLEPFTKLSWLWLLSIIGGYLAKLIHLPPLLGMLAAGLLIANISGEKSSIPEETRSVFTSAGLSIILLRSGLELDMPSVQRSSFLTMRLTCIPGIIEAFISGLFAMIFFEMPVWLALSLGFILSAVSPAVVVTGMLNLQQLGYGVVTGIPSLIIAAASFDDVLAIGGFSICIGLALPGEHSAIESALHGPLSLIYGIIVGSVAGAIMSITKVWDQSWKRTTIITLSSLSIMFGMKALSYSGSGAMGAMTLGLVSSYAWMNGKPSAFALEANAKYVHHTEQQVSIMWDLIFEPILFGCIGSALNFSLIPSGSLAKSVGIICIGSTFRLLSAFLATVNSGFSTKERIFVALAWLPKATVQAALCSFPLTTLKQTMSTEDVNFAKYLEWTEQILSTAILSICITAPLGVVAIKFLGKRCLEKDESVGGPGN
jgi:NhaP-type Na+/H+ or K+/H+ antiporter